MPSQGVVYQVVRDHFETCSFNQDTDIAGFNSCA